MNMHSDESKNFIVKQRTVAAGMAVLGGGSAATAVYSNWMDTKFRAYSFVGKAFMMLDPEDAHQWGIWAASNGWLPHGQEGVVPQLQTRLWGKTFPNPIGSLSQQSDTPTIGFME